jgi:hypothetical protein
MKTILVIIVVAIITLAVILFLRKGMRKENLSLSAPCTSQGIDANGFCVDIFKQPVDSCLKNVILNLIMNPMILSAKESLKTLNINEDLIPGILTIISIQGLNNTILDFSAISGNFYPCNSLCCGYVSSPVNLNNAGAVLSIQNLTFSNNNLTVNLSNSSPILQNSTITMNIQLVLLLDCEKKSLTISQFIINSFNWHVDSSTPDQNALAEAINITSDSGFTLALVGGFQNAIQSALNSVSIPDPGIGLLLCGVKKTRNLKSTNNDSSCASSPNNIAYNKIVSLGQNTIYSTFSGTLGTSLMAIWNVLWTDALYPKIQSISIQNKNHSCNSSSYLTCTENPNNIIFCDGKYCIFEIDAEQSGGIYITHFYMNGIYGLISNLQADLVEIQRTGQVGQPYSDNKGTLWLVLALHNCVEIDIDIYFFLILAGTTTQDSGGEIDLLTTVRLSIDIEESSDGKTTVSNMKIWNTWVSVNFQLGSFDWNKLNPFGVDMSSYVKKPLQNIFENIISSMLTQFVNNFNYDSQGNPITHTLPLLWKDNKEAYGINIFPVDGEIIYALQNTIYSQNPTLPLISESAPPYSDYYTSYFADLDGSNACQTASVSVLSGYKLAQRVKDAGTILINCPSSTSSQIGNCKSCTNLQLCTGNTSGKLPVLCDLCSTDNIHYNDYATSGYVLEKPPNGSVSSNLGPYIPDYLDWTDPSFTLQTFDTYFNSKLL